MNEDTNTPHSSAYREARAQFDQLKIEEKAQFLVEAMLVTIGRGLETAGETISREMEGVINSVRDTVRDARDAHRTPGAAEGAAENDPDTVTPPGASSPGTDWASKEDATGEPPATPGA